MGGKRMIAEEPNPSPDYNLDDIEFFEASKVVRNRRPLTKTQKAKRANTRIWKQLETVEHQLESVEIQIQGHIRVAKVKKLLGVVGRLLKVIETELELAVKHFKAYERELETIKRRAGAWTELMAVDQQLKSAGRELDTTTSRMEAKRELVMVEQQLEIVERRLLSARWEMENFRTSVKANTIQRTSNRRRTRRPPISRGFLTRWLNIIDVSEREQYWSKNKGRHTRITLPLILVEYLRLCANPNVCHGTSKIVNSTNLG